VKIAARAGDLARALALVAFAVPKITKVDALGAVQIVAADAVTVLAGGFIAIEVPVSAAIIEPGQVAVAHGRLAALIAGFPATASITIDTTTTAALIVSGNSRSRLAVIPQQDLVPALALDVAEISGGIEISGNDVLTLLEPVAAAEHMTTRFYLCGVSWQNIGDRLMATGTNGTRLIQTSISAGKFSERRDLIVPRETATILIRIIKGTRPARVRLRRSPRLLAVAADQFELVTRLIDAEFPDCDHVVPPPSSVAVTVAREELIAALSRLAAVATTDTPLLALRWGKTNRLYLALARQPGNGSDSIAADVEGSAQLAVALPLFSTVLSEIPEDRVRIENTEGDSPIRLSGGGDKFALASRSVWDFAVCAVDSKRLTRKEVTT
jgi:DNA polymerase III subunit beta